ncbi:50S ribosomal protein 5, chloroplastic-like [Durio zibethinus]|uniref:50S ribosomal protein 5, chloroplastic-like n=1 Tax=Durio zibethinus TaxID=66656 RepID=A0A6P5YSK2_DURZI|nr:50S ribosomal protein 5, chloroplastic-like [Durio zibethinus]
MVWRLAEKKSIYLAYPLRDCKEMALLRFNPLPCTTSSSVSSCSKFFPIAVLPIYRMRLKAIDHPPSKCLIATQFVPNKKRLAMTVKASSASTDGEAQLPAETKKEALPVERLPLESKMQQMMEQKMRMKLAKKIRLRRKRLVRKRKMRKKGRWPPSKMKKLKNV